MPYHNNIAQLVQKALQAYLRTQALSFIESNEQIYTSILDRSAITPNVLCKCSKARCVNTQEGNWKAFVEMELRENADPESDDSTPADDHHEHAGELFSKFATGTVETDLSAALDNFSCFQFIRQEQGWRVDGRLWVSYLTLELDVCGSDIS
jgi:hypothetical protein